MVRGIERRNIFQDDEDRHSFTESFSALLKGMGIQCLAWSLMTNHAHALLRPSDANLGQFMSRLLTGYAVRFNLRHRRCGHLFQNRYKSIVCEDDPYLLELVRYIHLNPMRTGLVKDLADLRSYPWSGHAAIMGAPGLQGQNIDEVLTYFSKDRTVAREKYEAFVLEGVELGKREEFSGGGLRRVLTLRGCDEITAYDDRILGSGDFVERLGRDKNVSERLGRRPTLGQLIEGVSGVSGIAKGTLRERRRGEAISEAKGVLCYFAVRKFGYSEVAVAKALGITGSGVCRAALRGEHALEANWAVWVELVRKVDRWCGSNTGGHEG